MALDNIVNNYRDGVKQLQPGTFQHVDELRAEQITDPSLRNNWYYTADANGYRVRGKEVEWGLARGNEGPILSNIDSAYEQLVQTGNFRISKDVSDVAFNAKDTLVTHLSQLRYRKDKSEKQWVYLEVRTKDGAVYTGKKYDDPNDAEAKVFERTGLTFKYLTELKAAGAQTTRTYFLNPDYVKKEVAGDPENRDLWRASRLYSFSNSSGFVAVDRFVINHYSLRGVSQVVAAGDATKNEVPSAPQEIITPARCYEVLLANPQTALAALDDARVAGLSRLVTAYLTAKIQ